MPSSAKQDYLRTESSTKPNYLRTEFLEYNSWGPTTPKQDGVLFHQNHSSVGFPIINNLSDLSNGVGLSVGELIWLCYRKPVSTVDHYFRFTIPKRSGGLRYIASPKPRLAHVQQWIKTNILDKVEIHSAACAYRAGRSIVDCAIPHQKKSVVIRLDIENFFPSINFFNVRQIFLDMGYNLGISTCFALLCTDEHRDKEIVDGQTRYISRSPSSPRHLPQGSSASPVISNIVMCLNDLKLSAIAADNGCSYTRYADDLFFSTDDEKPLGDLIIGKLIYSVKSTLVSQSLVINNRKTRVMKMGSRQAVVGIVVNTKLSVPRKLLRRLRSAIHWCEKYSLHHYMVNYIRGMVAYVRMIDRSAAEQLVASHPWIVIAETRRISSAAWVLRKWLPVVDIYSHKLFGAVVFFHPPNLITSAGVCDRKGFVVLEHTFTVFPWPSFVAEAKQVDSPVVRRALLQKVLGP
ncbi:reverse transcriptase family protein [uncultured Lamprocystis sp.]|jgi:retron-type reverse transcriptase|nr:reverse transcriptase family protein [uncultured Lamprocystis sp.]